MASKAGSSLTRTSITSVVICTCDARPADDATASRAPISPVLLMALSADRTFLENRTMEGDNLLALKALLPTHAGRVKCVYIDPPYNTGNEGWVYNDNLTQPQFKEWIGKAVGKEAEDACRHDKWCCMMYPRLALL